MEIMSILSVNCSKSFCLKNVTGETNVRNVRRRENQWREHLHVNTNFASVTIHAKVIVN